LFFLHDLVYGLHLAFHGEGWFDHHSQRKLIRLTFSLNDVVQFTKVIFSGETVKNLLIFTAKLGLFIILLFFV
jgi:hypothetical protein